MSVSTGFQAVSAGCRDSTILIAEITPLRFRHRFVSRPSRCQMGFKDCGKTLTGRARVQPCRNKDWKGTGSAVPQ